MTDKEIKVHYEVCDKYPGQRVKPVHVSPIIQGSIGEDLKIICSKFRTQIENKLHIDKIIEVLKKENLL